MAKAVYGHIGTVDRRELASSLAEVSRLRRRVAELETALDRACRANDALHREMVTSQSLGHSVEAELASLTEAVPA